MCLITRPRLYHSGAYCYRAPYPRAKVHNTSDCQICGKTAEIFSAILCEVVAQNSGGSMISQTGGGKGVSPKVGMESYFFSPKTA